ncbi:zincin-like metallopeptidase domain-containing protein [Flavobacterium sp. I-STPA6A]|uniref:zincin-like metallopeptidase domain-containing protein n=1 Tax=Flavobacterium sp. I-STPA6A TaxID=2590450 RepID=UPI00131C58C8|nr:zincin-like metallopeptidase domain-containing protein [Flavobacterium sp. I-STPA6A]
MSIANEFNALNGMIVHRKDLEKLLEKAERERHTIISKRVIKVLEAFADDTFLIEIKNLVEPYGLNGVDIDGNRSLLDGLEFIPETKDIGLGKPVSPNEIYDMVTTRMIDLIKDANKGDYKRAWKEEGYLIPYNFISKKAYRGVNVFMLSPMFGLLDNPYYLTFNQIQEKGGKIKKGSHAHKVVYFSTLNKEYSDAEIEKLNTVITDNKLEKGDEKTIFFLKYYNVFNGADIEGIDFDLDNFSLQGKVVNNEVETGDNETIDIAEAIVKNYPKTQPEIKFEGSKAFYSPSQDLVSMPNISRFKTSQDFYRTYFHELSHSTGHEKRLKRDLNNQFGDKGYAFEELIAEFGAVFLSAQAGIMFYTNKNHAGYLKGWNEVLLPNLENDNRFLMKASSQAQKSADFILQPDKNGDFLFMKDAKKKLEVDKTTKKMTKKPVKKQTSGILTLKSTKSKIKVPTEPVKIDKNGQYALLGAAKNGLNAPATHTKKIAKEKLRVTRKVIRKENLPKNGNLDKNSLAYKMANKPKDMPKFKIEDKDISRFLGGLERKNKESVVISLTGGQGSMKTRMCFQFMNAFAQNYKVGHASIEEHPDSGVYYDKAEQYLNEKAMRNIEAPEIKNISEIEILIKKNDVIVIDSFTKMQEMEKGFEIDKDLRKKYDGKLFIVIFQQTTDGKMRGGSKSQFDADIVLFTEKKEDYRENYIYADKNRYQNNPLDGLKFNIFNKKLEGNISEATTEPITKRKLSFIVN